MIESIAHIPFIPTPVDIVPLMLDLANVNDTDVLFDLGSGDGRIAIAAAKRCGARAVGVELDSELVRKSKVAAEEAGVDRLTTFLEADMFSAPLAGATVVTLYLLPSANLTLRERLRTELAPGARVVSHAFEMGDWVPSSSRVVNGHRLLLWTVGAERAR